MAAPAMKKPSKLEELWEKLHLARGIKTVQSTSEMLPVPVYKAPTEFDPGKGDNTFLEYRLKYPGTPPPPLG